MRHRWTAVLEAGLYLAVAASVVMAALWALGPNGAALVWPADLPPQLDRPVTRSFGLFDWTSPPVLPAVPLEEYTDLLWRARGTFPDAVDDGAAPSGYAEPVFGFRLAAYDPSLVQSVAWVGLQALTSLGIAWTWWTLARLVRSARTESPFTAGNARRLRTVGLLLLAGGLAVSLARRGVEAWLVETSSLSGHVDPPAYDVASVPWGILAVGAAVLALAAVWRRGVAMAEDLEGLV